MSEPLIQDADVTVGARVDVAGRGLGIASVDNGNGTWNIDFDDGTDGDIAEESLHLSSAPHPDLQPRKEDDAEDENGDAGLRCRKGGSSSAAVALAGLPAATTGGCAPFAPLGGSIGGCCGSSSSCGMPRGGSEFAAEAAAWSRPTPARRRKGDNDDDDGDPDAGWNTLDAELWNSEGEAQARRQRLSFIFFCLTVIPGLGTFLLTVGPYIDKWLAGPLVTTVPPGDTHLAKKIFAGGEPWLVSCVTAKGAKKKEETSGKASKLDQAAEILRPWGMKVARVHCWEPMVIKDKKQTLAQRYGFRDKPPVVLVTAGKGKPAFIDAGRITASQLANQAWNTAYTLRGEADKRAASSSSQTADKPEKTSRKTDKVGKRPAEEDVSDSGKGDKADSENATGQVPEYSAGGADDSTQAAGEDAEDAEEVDV
eukprot:TRINITY_DN45185_c0_g1_i1.p1 TRINITY_DN45185_c0_g1~~TRINITY_DN45185_c0_g1_i1.p1  ORF type:complete len:425 (+),score=102.27 TRINITY_DN45185_c0_g1_i1:64-1338(+)